MFEDQQLRMIGSGVERGELQRRREPSGSLPYRTVEANFMSRLHRPGFRNMGTGFQGLHSMLHWSVGCSSTSHVAVAYSCRK